LEKLYADRLVTSNDQRLIEHCNLLSMLYENEQKEHHKKAGKAICDSIRNSLKISNVIGLSMNEDKDTVMVFIYEREAMDECFYDQHFDKELNNYYILV